MVDVALVPFHGYELQSWKEDNDTVYVGMRYVCKTLGLDWASQSVKLSRSHLFKEYTRYCDDHNTSGGIQRVLGLELGMLPMYLAGINVNKVAPAIRETLLLFQRECADVLKAYWFRKTEPSVLAPEPEVLKVSQRSRPVPLDKMELLERAKHFLMEDEKYTPELRTAMASMVRSLVFQTFPRPAKLVV